MSDRRSQTPDGKLGNLGAFIKSVGFPVAACVGMGAYIWFWQAEVEEQLKDVEKEIGKVEKKVEDLTSHLEAIRSNQDRMERMAERLGDRIYDKVEKIRSVQRAQLFERMGRTRAARVMAVSEEAAPDDDGEGEGSP
jgi:regulator of replication initiation timing